MSTTGRQLSSTRRSSPRPCSMSRPAMWMLRSRLCPRRGRRRKRSARLRIRDWWSEHNGCAPASRLSDAQFDLDQTVVRAPSPGYVTQMALRPGMYVIPAPLRPVMVFVHKDDQELAAGFEQNALQRVRVGDEAEVAFDALPGTDSQGQGEVRARCDRNGTAPSDWHVCRISGGHIPGGRAVAIIDITDDTSGYNLPGGSEAQVALYTPLCAPLRHHPAHPAAHAELAELRVS